MLYSSDDSSCYLGFDLSFLPRLISKFYLTLRYISLKSNYAILHGLLAVLTIYHLTMGDHILFCYGIYPELHAPSINIHNIDESLTIPQEP